MTRKSRSLLDRETRILIEALAEAPDDPAILVNVADVDPHDFFLFMREESLLNDRVAKRLYQAALERRDVGRDISPRASGLGGAFSKEYAAHVRALDQQINQLLPLGIRAPRQNKNVPFQTDKLLLSLASIGIPVQTGIAIAEKVLEFQERRDIATGELDTGALRLGVLRAIYSLPRNIIDRSIADHWATRYAQRYGNPKVRTTLQFDASERRPLSYSLIRDRVIPALIERVLGVGVAEARAGGISTQDLDSIAKQILEVALSLPAYNIRFELLLDIAEELSTQPPHPWFVRSWLFSDTVRYDLERAGSHAARLKKLWDSGQTNLYRHSAVECIHHSASAFLGYYGAFLGPEYLEPVHRLAKYINGLRHGRVYTAWDHLRITQMPGDMRACGEDIGEFAEHIDIITRNMNDAPATKWRDFRGWATGLHGTVRKVLMSRREELDNPIAQGALSTGKGLYDLVRSLISRRVDAPLSGEDGPLPALSLTTRRDRIRVLAIGDAAQVRQLRSYLTDTSPLNRPPLLVFCSSSVEVKTRDLVAGTKRVKLIGPANAMTMYRSADPHRTSEMLLSMESEEHENLA
ncbi:hypothetical protein [Gemmatimonas aurantiaca]|uniref:hypothetical protein n=1 Tax=Gemmatimonas aurantiaca TaxID=173480 RepID=UPI00301C3E8D